MRVTVAGATVGGAALDATPTGAPYVAGDQVIQPRGDFAGVHHLGLDGVEQTFVFESLPGHGELIVRLGVETELTPSAEGAALSFTHPTLGRVEVGTAFAIDGDGSSVQIERRWNGEGIDLVVPADFVAAASLPLTIDPVWSTFSSGFGVADDAQPDVVYAGESDRYVVVWEEYTSQANRDVYATFWDEDLANQGASIAIDMTSEDWTGPAAAYSNAYDRVLVAASVGLGTNQSRVEGRMLDVAQFVTNGQPFLISTTGSTQKSSVDVGGSNEQNTVQSRFAVSWSRRFNATNSNVEYRVLRGNGVFMTDVEAVDTSVADDIQASISQGLGDTDLIGDNWHLVWIRDDNQDGRGEVWGMRVHFNGSPLQSSDPFMVHSSSTCAHPVVSSLLDEIDPHTGVRPAVVAFDRGLFDNTRPSGFQTDLYVRIISGDATTVLNHLLTQMEDIDRSLLQERPQIASNGRTVFIAYHEEEPAFLNANRWNTFMTSGELADNGSRLTLALAERHVMLAESSDSETGLAITSRWNGEVNSSSIRGAAVWGRELASAPSSYGRIEGAGFTYLLPQASTLRAVGRQYGDALPTSVGAEHSSWLRVFGDQGVGTTHLAQARELPPNQFGFLLASRNSGLANNPGGSAGRLLLAGAIGRYTSQVASSGASGNLDFAIDPQAIPQPGGPEAAMAGETWYFQAWHRDTVNLLPTSNFTNGVIVTFAN